MTPLEYLYSDKEGNSIYIKRDDLIPFSFGGNKIRIANEFIDDLQLKQFDCMVGYGNARSNLSRAISNLCMSKGIKCHIISPSDDDGSRIDTYNSLLVKRCGVRFHECDKNNVSDTVEHVMQQCIEEGYNPYYIYGDKYGKGNESVPVTAYIKAYHEIQMQLADINTRIDYIFLATGTGMTQSGLIAGKKIYCGNETIIGISVARDKEKERNVIKSYLDSYISKQTFTYNDEDIIIDDSYLCGGYGKYDDTVEKTINTMYSKYGIPLDPTYSGKSFTGMIDYISKHGIKGKNILFIHTGGTPLFFDFLKKQKENANVEVCKDFGEITEFLNRIDSTLPTPLSQRIDISEYALKIIERGNVLVVYDNAKIVAAVLFYANDSINKKAYITLIATDPTSENTGYGGSLLEVSEKSAKQAGMRYMTLETEFCNNRAIAFYTKRGYKVDFADQKLHMIKEL